MKRDLWIAGLLMSLASSAAAAESRQKHIPVPAEELGAIAALLDSEDQLGRLMAYGDLILAARRSESPNVSDYQVDSGTCVRDPSGARVCAVKGRLLFHQEITPGGSKVTRTGVVELTQPDKDRKGTELSEIAVATLDALTHAREFLLDLRTAGNQVTSATRQSPGPLQTVFQITTRFCRDVAGASQCLGGAVLRIESKGRFEGGVLKYAYSSTLARLRS